MKRMLLLIAAAMLAACANTNTNSNNKAVIEPELNWAKPQYCIGAQGDTIARWVYDQEGKLSQLYILGQLFQDEHSGEFTVNGCYGKFDGLGRLDIIITGDEESTYRYDFEYGFEEEEIEDDSAYPEDDVEIEYDDHDRVTSKSCRVNMSYFADTRTYEGRVCHVDAYTSIPVMDELGWPLFEEDPIETKYQYSIYY